MIIIIVVCEIFNLKKLQKWLLKKAVLEKINKPTSL